MITRCAAVLHAAESFRKSFASIGEHSPGRGGGKVMEGCEVHTTFHNTRITLTWHES